MCYVWAVNWRYVAIEGSFGLRWVLVDLRREVCHNGLQLWGWLQREFGLLLASGFLRGMHGLGCRIPNSFQIDVLGCGGRGFRRGLIWFLEIQGFVSRVGGRVVLDGLDVLWSVFVR